MSWFSEIASKAEAMLVKLDQDAAQVLQNNNEANHTRGRSIATASAYDNSSEITDPSRDIAILVQNSKVDHNNFSEEPSQSETTKKVPQASQEFTNELPNSQTHHGNAPLTISDNYLVDLDQTSSQDVSRKFTIQASRRNLFGASIDQNTESSPKMNNVSYDKTVNLGKKSKDIRESIKQSLREYSTRVVRDSDQASSQGSYTSHFDSQPNLIRHSSPINNHYDSETRQDRPGHSPSLSISVPEEETLNASLSNDIAVRLLRETAAKRRSLSYIHEILNRLTDPDRHSVLIDQARFKLRRARLRGTSYARRLNYYFRAYPHMKYAMLIYLIVMQLLVVYVLFFYQSGGGSPGDFASKVDESSSSKIQ